MERRNFLKSCAISGVASSVSLALGEKSQAETRNDASQNSESSSSQIPLGSSPGTMQGEMLYRTLGKTGEKVSAIGLGGFHVAKTGVSEDESIRLIRAAIDRGITFMDNSWDYNEGQSELRMGKVLKDGYRQKVFLMTKIDGRTKSVAQGEIESAL